TLRAPLPAVQPVVAGARPGPSAQPVVAGHGRCAGNPSAGPVRDGQRSGTEKRLVTTRARTVSTTTRTIRVRAAPQARSWAPAKGSWALLKIWDDRAVVAPPNTCQFRFRAAPMVNSSGPLTIPERAAGRTTVMIVRARLAPRARLASRRPAGTSRRISSVERMTIGSM